MQLARTVDLLIASPRMFSYELGVTLWSFQATHLFRDLSPARSSITILTLISAAIGKQTRRELPYSACPTFSGTLPLNPVTQCSTGATDTTATNITCSRLYPQRSPNLLAKAIQKTPVKEKISSFPVREEDRSFLCCTVQSSSILRDATTSIRILKLQTSKYGADINSVMLDYKTSSSNV